MLLHVFFAMVLCANQAGITELGDFQRSRGRHGYFAYTVKGKHLRCWHGMLIVCF